MKGTYDGGFLYQMAVCQVNAELVLQPVRALGN